MQNFLAWELRVERLRRAVLAALEEARDAFEQALQPDQPNTFTWHGEMFWVDRVRRFVVPVEASEIRDDAWASRDTLVEDDEDTKDTLDIYAGDSQLEDTGAFLGMWARVITGATSRGLWQITGAKFINLAIAQPKINPAFGPLLWLFLADDMGAGTLWDYADNLFKRVGPMIYQLIDYPRLTPSPEEVRRAQIDFLEGLLPGTTDASCAQLSDGEWAARCEDQLRRHQRLVDDRFFAAVLEKIGALGDLDARKFE
jgi:hypothetical protein